MAHYVNEMLNEKFQTTFNFFYVARSEFNELK